MMKTVTLPEVEAILPVVRAALVHTIEDTAALLSGTAAPVVYAAFQMAMIEKSAELAKQTFATSRVDFALAAHALYDDDSS